MVAHQKGCLPEGFCTVRFPLVFHNGTTSNHRAGPILRLDQLQSEARSRFVHNNLFQRLPSTGGEAKLPVIGWDKYKGKSQS